MSKYCLKDLMRAIKHGSLKKVKKILGKDEHLINEETDDGRTPLTQACEYCNLEIVKYLLEQGANPNYVNTGYGDECDTALTICLEYDFDDERQEIAQSLVSYGANVNIVDEREGNLLNRYVFTDNSLLCIKKDKSSILRFLLKNGIDTSSALIEAVYNKNPKYVKILVEFGVDVNQCHESYNEKGECEQETAFELACRLKQSKIAKFLLDHGAKNNVDEEMLQPPVPTLKEKYNYLLKVHNLTDEKVVETFNNHYVFNKW